MMRNNPVKEPKLRRNTERRRKRKIAKVILENSNDPINL
jgi:hypothetical protein